MTNFILLTVNRKWFSNTLWTGNQWECTSLGNTEKCREERIIKVILRVGRRGTAGQPNFGLKLRMNFIFFIFFPLI